ncbi:hypothetical protein K431DRAFT_302209 [Polychaeton citri CBS 116435]|uniref:DUF7082 domain-containing protein n=1 Tax=Polychaeton citri CBS 116435 TaxID=1314669 RepID=A0A9P4USD2_9PEZI|nr:hypothetical protein K431DRAFT_302209 [Polychaeton citri CBS 116435]
MSEYDKGQPYDVYDDYDPATRPAPAQSYTALSHQAYTPGFVATQPQVPSGLPNPTSLALLPSAQAYGPHDTNYYPQTSPQYPAYLPPAPRQLPTVFSYTPHVGHPGSKVSVYFRTIYDLENPPVQAFIMFGHKRCDSVLSKSLQQDQQFTYSATSTLPEQALTGSISPQVSLSLGFDGNVSWESPTLDFGQFTYLEQASYYPSESVQDAPRKRKLSVEAGERRSPSKKPSLQQLGGQAVEGAHSAGASLPALPQSPYTGTIARQPYPQTRRFSVPSKNHQSHPGRSIDPYDYLGEPSSRKTPGLPNPPTPVFGYGYQQATRSPSMSGLSGAPSSSQLMPSPAGSAAPPLIRTSTLHSPIMPGTTPTVTQSFNPYAMYPSNTKAMLKIEGDLDSMKNDWAPEEKEAKRRLVQFNRSQTGSVITATFKPVTLEERSPNSICVSCIWWEERGDCWVTSVDTISLLESLVAVRFTVEEKNRIRRNLEGFRPATVSKVKPDSEEFFKLIMGFPNPKPRNIEKDVKVFPWRILAGALKKIIGKYSASYSSTAGALHTPSTGSYTMSRSVESGMDQQHQPARPGASPHSTSSSAASHGPTYVASLQGYGPHAAGSVGPPDLRLAMSSSTQGQGASWHQSSTQYSSDLSAASRSPWDFSGYMSGASSATGMPTSAHPAPYSAPQFPSQHQHRMMSASSQAGLATETRFVPLHDYEEQGHQTSGA